MAGPDPGTAEGDLPAAARARLARFDPEGVRTSLLPVAGAAGCESVGLEPVGDVMGGIVQYFGWVGGAAMFAGPYQAGPVSYQPYVQALEHGYHTALARMYAEATAMGADGVVDVRISRDPLGENNQEFRALGTAVRARSAHRPQTVFGTELPGQDVAKLMTAGWVPVRIAFGVAVQARYVDFVSAQQMSVLAGNVEVDGFTELITAVRAQARASFTRHAGQAGGDGAIVSAMRLRTWAQETSSTPVQCAESAVFGTVVARFARGSAPPRRSLMVMPLRNRSEKT